jgi:hypothetical protein
VAEGWAGAVAHLGSDEGDLPVVGEGELLEDLGDLQRHAARHLGHVLDQMLRYALGEELGLVCACALERSTRWTCCTATRHTCMGMAASGRGAAGVQVVRMNSKR